jgi:hypothetical protein
MTSYNPEYSTSLSQSYIGNSSSISDLDPDIENENDFSFYVESKDSSTYCLNCGIFQEDCFQRTLPEKLDLSSFFQSNSIFSSEEEEETEEKKKIYYIEESEGSMPTGQAKKFEVKKEDFSKNDCFTAIKKKRGRGKANSDINDKTHDKFAPDNLLRKIQVHYLTFIISFLNEILLLFKFPKKFLKLDYEFKKNVNKKKVQELKEQKIRDIVCNKISKKYRNVEYSNSSICEQIKDNEVLNKILSENYLSLFKKIYYKSSRIINLKEYGLDQNIVLSKEVKMFDDLLKCNDKEAFDDKDQYKKYLGECALQNYLPESETKILFY